MRRHLPLLSIVAAILGALSLFFGDGQPLMAAETPDISPPPAVAEQPQPEGWASLPCFRCHAPERFTDPAVFPHDSHIAMGLHCNQCHIMKAHESMALNGETCKECHNLATIAFAKTSMSATFDHEMHASMFGCRNCHDGLFAMKAGSASVTMAAIYEGKYCGKCHNGDIASGPNNCASCHKD